MTVPPGWLRFDPPVIAHRGASACAPENTLAAFTQAKADGARWVETDVKLSRDGVPILLHDDTLDRTTNGAGPAAAQDWDALAKLDAGSWYAAEYKDTRIPQLTELLDFLKVADMRLNLELKPCPGRVRETTETVLATIAKQYPAHDPPILLSSFEAEALTLAARLQPNWPRGLLMEGWQDDWGERAAACNAATLHPNATTLNEARLRSLCARGLPVIPWVVNDGPRARQLLGWGVAAVFTDDPARLLAGLR